MSLTRSLRFGTLCTLLIALAQPREAHSQMRLLGADNAAGRLLEIDSQTGASAVIGPFSHPFVASLTWDSTNGAINFFDINPFVTALSDMPTYAAMYCGGDACAVDVGCDGAVNFFDIDPFIQCQFATCAACP